MAGPSCFDGNMLFDICPEKPCTMLQAIMGAVSWVTFILSL